MPGVKDSTSRMEDFTPIKIIVVGDDNNDVGGLQFRYGQIDSNCSRRKLSVRQVGVGSTNLCAERCQTITQHRPRSLARISCVSLVCQAKYKYPRSVDSLTITVEQCRD